MSITAAEYLLILEALRHQYGMGYSKIAEISRLQAKLSILLEVAQKSEAAQGGKDDPDRA